MIKADILLEALGLTTAEEQEYFLRTSSHLLVGKLDLDALKLRAEEVKLYVHARNFCKSYDVFRGDENVT